jgi:hypothetical protein
LFVEFLSDAHRIVISKRFAIESAMCDIKTRAITIKTNKCTNSTKSNKTPEGI